MTTRVFRGRSIHDARRAATAALGEDAIVLTSREVRRGGIFGLLGATEVEVAAARMPLDIPAKAPTARGPFAAGAYGGGRSPLLTTPSERPAKKPAFTSTARETRSDARFMRSTTRRPAEPGLLMASLAADISEIRGVLDSVDLPRVRGKAGALLRARGIEGPAAAALSKALKVGGSSTLEDQLRHELGAMIQVSPWALPPNGRRLIVAAVGPSGVGKTTTLAKLGTLARASGRSVAFVTCDTFRVGGVEHVQRYASLLDVAFETARSADELHTFLARNNADVVLVDTSGREPTRDAPELLLGESFADSDVGAAYERRVLLCVTAACRAVDAARITRAFAPNASSLLAVTKLDETTQPSGIIHAARASRLPITLTCAGQRVPEDLDPANLTELLQQLVPSGMGRKDRAA